MKELIAMGPAFALVGPELNCRKKLSELSSLTGSAFI